MTDEASTSDLARLLNSVVLLASEYELDDLLTHVTDEARAITGARYAALGIVDPNTNTLSSFITSGIPPHVKDAIGAQPTGKGVLGKLIADPRPLRIADLTTHSQSQGFPPGHPRMKSFLGVPVIASGAIFGNFYLTDKTTSTEFTTFDEHAVVTLAAVAAIGVENTRLRSQSLTIALHEERHRIARDLHDTTIQRLFAIGLNLQATLQTAPPQTAAKLKPAIADIDSTIEDIRTTIFGLEPNTTQHSPRQSIITLVNELRPTLDSTVTLTFTGPIDTLTPPAVITHLLAVTRESLANVARHAQASNVHLTLTATPSSITLEVTDDGIGIQNSNSQATKDTAQQSDHGNGLHNLAFRASQMGGTFALTAPPGGGTTATFTLPLSRDEPQT
jgi:signal transduction histidine kinase